MTKKKQKFDRFCQLWGWGLFIISALFFCWASLKSGDPLSFLGSFFFLVACLVFLVPFFTGNHRDNPTGTE